SPELSTGTGVVLDGLRILDHLGNAVDVLSLAIAAQQAKAAMDSGDPARAQSILTDWMLEYGGALAAGRLAAIATAPLLAAGPLGVLLAGGITLGASVAGGMFADDLARALWETLSQWTDGLIDGLEELFYRAESVSSPIILDLDGNGIPTLAEQEAGVHFDHDGDGFAERTGWVTPGDGLLVRDLDGDGAITRGAELFGNQTLMPDGRMAYHGFDALQTLDANGDGRIDASDPAWQDLRIWQDGNTDGRVDPGELLHLAEADVLQLNLNYLYGFQIDPQGNFHRQLGTYVSSDGITREMVDVWFAVDPARTEFLHAVPVTAEIQALPDLPGIGRVPDLHQAMMADGSGTLADLVRQWIESSASERAQLMEPLLLHWAGVQDYINPDSLDAIEERRRLAALEQFLGRTFRDGWMDPVPGIRAYTISDQAFLQLSTEIGAQLIAQVDALPLLRTATTEEAIGLLRTQHQALPDVERLIRLGTVLDRLGEGGAELRASLGEWGAGESDLFGLQLQGMARIDTYLAGTEMDDRMLASSEPEWIEGGPGNDEIHAYAGADVLVGGPGDDVLSGGSEGDRYLFSRGDGKDRITDYDATAEAIDQVRFVDLLPEDILSVVRNGTDLELHIGSTDSLTVGYHFLDPARRIEEFHFSDGTVWTHDEVALRVLDGALT
ncbi:MAG: calcium-binding protein, partial [Synechococcaceae cyanobacterium]|nr:calcium-binding protein [Synechococcaceae cyanobacterium]